MTGYVRIDTANNIADGNIINAADFDAEYDAIEAAFIKTTGHSHDGSDAEGAPITKVGPAQNLVVSTTSVLPKTTNVLDLGSSLLKFKDLYFTGVVTAANGGTGLTTPGTTGNVLTSNGTTWSSSAPTAQVYPGAGIAVSTGTAWGTSKATPTGVIVGDTDSQTLTNKTVEAGTFTNGYTEETVTANTGTAYTIDLANGTVQILTLTGNCTFTYPTATAGRGFTLILKQDATGSRTVTWPATVKWPSSTAPTITSTASRSDKYVFVADGTNWIASNAGQNYTL